MPILMLALVEALALLSVPYVAALLRFDSDLTRIEASVGPIWPRAILFTFLMQMSMVAMGLYSARLRATFTGILMRIVTSACVATAAIALIYYFLPGLHLGRGVMAYSATAAIVGVAFVRFVFSRLVDESIFKRRVLVYGSGRQAMSISQLRRRTDQRGFSIVGYVRPEGDREMVPQERVCCCRNARCSSSRASNRSTRSSSRWTTAAAASRCTSCSNAGSRGIDVIDLVDLPRARDRQGAPRRAQSELDHLRRRLPSRPVLRLVSERVVRPGREPRAAGPRLRR